MIFINLSFCQGSRGFRAVLVRFRMVPAGSGRFRMGSTFYIHRKAIQETSIECLSVLSKQLIVVDEFYFAETPTEAKGIPRTCLVFWFRYESKLCKCFTYGPHRRMTSAFEIRATKELGILAFLYSPLNGKESHCKYIQ